MAEAFQACRAASQSISAASNGGRGSQEAADACSSRRRAIRCRHSAVDEGRGGHVIARHIVVDYTECDKNSPYREMNYSPVYSRFTDTKDIVHDDATDHWQERYEEVSCNLYTRNSFDDSNDVSTTYLGYYKSKGEERTFPIDNHIPIDEEV